MTADDIDNDHLFLSFFAAIALTISRRYFAAMLSCFSSLFACCFMLLLQIRHLSYRHHRYHDAMMMTPDYYSRRFYIRAARAMRCARFSPLRVAAAT